MPPLAIHNVSTDIWLNMKALIIAERLGLPTAAYEWSVRANKEVSQADLRAAVGAQVSTMTGAEQMETWLQRFDQD